MLVRTINIKMVFPKMATIGNLGALANFDGAVCFQFVCINPSCFKWVQW